MESLVYDLRLALRQLSRRPLFTGIGALSIAVGIGATTTLLSAAYTMLLAPPPGVTAPERLVEIGRTNGGEGFDTFSYPELLDMRAGAGSVFTAVAGWTPEEVSYSSGGEPSRAVAFATSWNYFAVMGVTPGEGRFFAASDDDTPGAHSVAVLSDEFWRRQLGADPSVVGRTIEINRQPFTVIGVAPSSFRGHIIGIHPDLYAPITMLNALQPGGARGDQSIFDSRRASWLQALGRLRPGVTLAQANAALAAVFARVPQDDPDPRSVRSARVESLKLVPAAGRGPVTGFFGLLIGLACVVLLVTCANVAGMLLARAAARSREIAIRLALGSGRARLVRQLLAEALLVFGLGGAIGLALTVWGTRLLSDLPLPARVPISLDFSPDPRVLAVGLALALLTGLAFGLAPALQSTRRDLGDAMRTGATAVGGSTRLRSVFVMTQLGLSLVLLLASGMFLRALERAAQIPTGFDATGVSTVSVDLALDGYDQAHGDGFAQQVLARLAAQPGIAGAGIMTDLPLDLGRSSEPAYVPGSPAAEANGYVDSDFNTVTGGTFAALGIRVLRGRTFDTRDAAGAAQVMIVSRTFAERVWPHRDPIGQSVTVGGGPVGAGTVRTVVGEVENVKTSSLTEAATPAFYVPLSQDYHPTFYFVVRGDAGTDAGTVLRSVLRDADPALSTGPIQSLEAITSLGIMPQRIAASLSSTLGLIALLLSAIGVYGVVAFTVAQRTREIGVRMALGARRADVMGLILRTGLRLAVPGLAIGAVVGLAMSVALRSFVLGVPPGDPVAFLGAPALLLAAVALACWTPARRAARIDPMEALRAE